MVHIVNYEGLINLQSEIHYRFRTQIEAGHFPQVHDFYEIMLVTDGEIRMNLCGKQFLLDAGSLILIRPGDIHDKSGNNCCYINLAFTPKALDELFLYLRDQDSYAAFSNLELVPPVYLNHQDFLSLKEKIQYLNTIPASQSNQTSTLMRIILFEIMTRYISPVTLTDYGSMNIPNWLADALTAWQSNENRQKSLEFFCQQTGYTKEYICRSFKRYLGVSPTEYLNQQRLNYALNLMGHSDYSILEIAYEAGFKSASRFYHLFHEMYGMSPKQFLQQTYQYI